MRNKDLGTREVAMRGRGIGRSWSFGNLAAKAAPKLTKNYILYNKNNIKIIKK